MLTFSTFFGDEATAFSTYQVQHLSTLERLTQQSPRYKKSLGWYDVEEWASPKQLKNILTLAKEVRLHADVLVIIGVGGSNNAARAAIEAFQLEGPDIIYAGNTLSANAIDAVLKELDNRSVYINCIAKNFETLEPGSTFRLLRQYLQRVYGDQAAERIIVTGSDNSQLDQLSQQQGYHYLTFPDNIGGRFSALTNVGLFPMAVAGIDIEAMVCGAKELSLSLQGDVSTSNPAFHYACYRNYLYQQNYHVELLAVFEPQLRYFSKWWIQLFAESEGKEGKGIFPAYAEYSEDLHSLGQFVQDGNSILFETFLKINTTESNVVFPAGDIEDNFDYLTGQSLATINHIAYEATISAHRQTTPVAVLEVEKLNAECLGKLFYFFEFACYLSAEILGVNPFDQPGVESYKEKMFKYLKEDK